MTAQSNGGDQGFTLIEALVVLTIAAAAIALVPATVTLGQRALQVAANAEQITSDQRGLSAVTNRLAGARLAFQTNDSGISALVFEGGPDRLRFVSEFIDGPSGGGLYVVDLGLDAANTMLSLSLTPYPIEAVPADIATRTSIRSASGLSLRYFGLDRETGERRWQTRWMGQVRLPEMVELTIEYGRGRSSTTIVAPGLAAR